MDNKANKEIKVSRVSNKIMDKANNRTEANKAGNKANKNSKIKAETPKTAKINNNKVKLKTVSKGNKVPKATNNRVSNWITKSKTAIMITMVTASPMY